ncbi:MAG: RNA polymerase sigma factor [Chloroflexota bacterium]
MRSIVDIGPRAADAPTWEAFEARVASRVADAHRLAAAIVGPDDAADVVQEALVEAWRHLGSVRDPDRLEAWFRSIVINRCRNVLRTRGRRPRTTPIQPDAAGMGAADAPEESVVVREALDQAFGRLSPEHRTVLALRYTLDLPLVEIARTLRVPEGTVKSRLHAAIARLRATYEEDGR